MCFYVCFETYNVGNRLIRLIDAFLTSTRNLCFEQQLKIKYHDVSSINCLFFLQPRKSQNTDIGA